MMDKEKLKEMSKSVEKYNLQAAMPIEELFQLMTERWNTELPAGPFIIKKGIMGQSIVFPTYQRIQPIVTIKGNTVVCKKTEGSQVKVMGVDHKDRKQRGKAFQEGKAGGGFMDGLKNSTFGGVEYYIGVCNTLRGILQDKM